ncbi:cobalamin B12-binding domain-containing protein [Streptomyces sp. NPDC007971]|uniref:cobalamin B12-binding domain-containing protein n=1 Tax=Streptomyces sp. NPDC007971 TaxID=3364799 RepID=UPI0036E297A1
MPSSTVISDREFVLPPYGRRIILSSVSSDSHTWNLVYLQLLLEEWGHEVHNLGACVPDDLVLRECRDHRPDLVVISSVNGHGFLDGRRLITRLRREPDLAQLPVVIGGKLGTDGAAGGAHGPALRTAGFTAVFEGDAAIDGFRAYVRQVPALAQGGPPALAQAGPPALAVAAV